MLSQLCICQVDPAPKFTKNPIPQFRLPAQDMWASLKAERQHSDSHSPNHNPNRCQYGDPDLLWERKNSLFKGITVPLPENEAGTGDVSLRQESRVRRQQRVSMHLKEAKGEICSWPSQEADAIQAHSGAGPGASSGGHVANVARPCCSPEDQRDCQIPPKDRTSFVAGGELASGPPGGGTFESFPYPSEKEHLREQSYHQLYFFSF